MDPEMGTEHFEQTLQLLRDPAFVAIRRRAEDSPLLWHEFTLMPQPAGLSHTETWALLTSLRRQTAIEFAPYIIDGEGRSGWYSLTRSMRSDLADIDRRCHRDSWLDSVIRSRNAAHFVAEAHISDALPAVREDGVTLEVRRAREILFGERTATTPEERVLLNTHRVMLDLESYAAHPFSPELIRELHRRVSDGAVQRTKSLPPLTAGSWLSGTTADEMLDVIARGLNNDGWEEAHHPVLQAYGLAVLLTGARPLPSWNGVIATLLTRLLFLRSHLPVLAFVPIIPLHRAWQDGLIRPPIVPAPQEDSLIPIGREVDLTIYCAGLVRLARLELNATERALRRMLRHDEALSDALMHDAAINHRQRQVLGAALNDPAAVFKMAGHQAIHGVVYATARADLLGLVDLGFLRCSRQGRAFVFTPVPGLLQRVKRRAKASGGTVDLADADVTGRSRDSAVERRG
jgi:hypothetical protein